MKIETTSGTTIVSGIFLPLLTLLFIGLKLTGVIGWSWWWVLAPLWGGIAIWLALLLLLIVGGLGALGVVALVSYLWSERNPKR